MDSIALGFTVLAMAVTLIMFLHYTCDEPGWLFLIFTVILLVGLSFVIGHALLGVING